MAVPVSGEYDAWHPFMAGGCSTRILGCAEAGWERPLSRCASNYASRPVREPSQRSSLVHT
jgi:hypothetical protein